MTEEEWTAYEEGVQMGWRLAEAHHMIEPTVQS